MATYNLPYKYELEYVHLDGKASFRLPESLISDEGLFSVKYKYDEQIPGLVVTSYGNGGNNVYDMREPSSYVHFRPDNVQTTARNFVGVSNAAIYFDTKCGSTSTTTSDSYCGRSIDFYVTGSDVANQKVIGYHSTVYLNKGERLCIYGCCDDTLFISVNGVQKYFKYSDDAAYSGSPGDAYHYFHGWTYTVPETGYYEFDVIGANHAGPGGAATDGAPFRMTLAPAGAKYTEISSSGTKPTTGNTVGDICRVVTSTTSGSKTYSYFYEYIWNGKSWVTQRLGNVDLSEPRFFIPEYCTLLPMYPYGYSATVTATGSSRQQHYANTLTSNFTYGNRLAKDGSVTELNTGDLTEVTTITYSGGTVYQNETAIAQKDASATYPAQKNYSIPCVGHLYTGYSYYQGLVGNLYSVELSNKTSTVNTQHELYPVMANDNTIKLYNLKTGSFVSATKCYSGTVLTPGPVSHAHDKYFVTKYDYPMPYDREVGFLTSNGLCWFGEGMYPGIEKDKPYKFLPYSETRYCVIDNLGNPCLYDRLDNKFYYNQGIGRLFGSHTVHTNDHFFQSQPERLRAIPGNTELLTGEDINYAYKMTEFMPDPNTSDSKVVIPTKAMDGFSEGQVVIARKSGKTYKWATISAPTEGVGAPYNVRSSKLGNKVNIRWKDPEDTKDKSGSVVIRKWRYTRLVRKAGEYPKGPYDGILVVQNSVRDYYNDKMLIDTLPPNVNGIWYYKLYAFSDDNVASTSEDAQFTPLDMDWTKMSSYIQTGKAQSIFGIGDEVTISGTTPFTGTDAVWNDLTFVVAGFDQASPVNTKLTHSVTLVSKILPVNTVFDKAWGKYKLVTGGKADKTVTYYVQDGPTSYKKASPQPTPGMDITASMGYYIMIDDSRKINGSNRWNESPLRKWLNAVKLYEFKLSTDTSVGTGVIYYTQNADGTYSEVPSSMYPGANPSKLGWYVKASSTPIEYVHAALPPLLAIKQMDTGFYNCLITVNDVTALAEVHGAGSTINESKVSVPSYTQLTGTMNGAITENVQITLFKDEDKGLKRYKPSPWWTRSPSIADGYSTLYYIDNEGVIKTTSDLINARGVCLIVNIG